jgi:hypothetical protein
MRRRRKPRLFSFPYEVELSHYSGVIHSPSEREVLKRTLEAFIQICHCKRVTDETLAALVAAARHESPHLRGLGLLRLTVLCHYFGEAVDTLAVLAKDTDPALRRFVAPMLSNTPAGVAVPLVKRLLADEDWSVRKAAALVGSGVYFEELMPVLSHRMAREEDARVRVVLQLAVDFQRQGKA